MRFDVPSSRPPMRRRISSISISEPVGFLAPLLAAPFADAEPPSPFPPSPPVPAFEPPADTQRLSPLSTAPVAVAHTQSVAIPLGRLPARSTAGLRSLILGTLGVLGVSLITLLVVIGGARSRVRAARALPRTDPSTQSVAAVAALPGASAVAAAAPTSTSTSTSISTSTIDSSPRLEPRPDAKPNVKASGVQTVVVLPRSSAGHRIFVDGHVVGSGPEPVTVKCGRHAVKIGSAGKPRIKDLPCGGEITLPPN
jgi:hypothetical protein